MTANDGYSHLHTALRYHKRALRLLGASLADAEIQKRARDPALRVADLRADVAQALARFPERGFAFHDTFHADYAVFPHENFYKRLVGARAEIFSDIQRKRGDKRAFLRAGVYGHRRGHQVVESGDVSADRPLFRHYQRDDLHVHRGVYMEQNIGD